MHEREATSARQGAHVPAVHGDFPANGKARLEVRVVLAIFAVVVETEWFAADVAAHGLAESRETRADLGVFAFHADAGDELRGEGFFFHGEVAGFEDVPR